MGSGAEPRKPKHFLCFLMDLEEVLCFLRDLEEVAVFSCDMTSIGK